jgi:hypothetical protein
MVLRFLPVVTVYFHTTVFFQVTTRKNSSSQSSQLVKILVFNAVCGTPGFITFFLTRARHRTLYTP